MTMDCTEEFVRLNLKAMDRDRFIRIAMALLKNEYRFRPQRLAVASKMYSRWIERKNNQGPEKVPQTKIK